MASAAVQSGDDDTARRHLTERKRVQSAERDMPKRACEAHNAWRAPRRASIPSVAGEKLESILKENMANAAELNARPAAAKFAGARASALAGATFEDEDPLEKKFRELEGK